MAELMLPWNPDSSKKPNNWVNPFSVSLNTFVDYVRFGLYYPWVRELTITIRANSRIRYGLAAYANQRAGNWNNNTDPPNDDLVITVKTLSPVTQNTLFSTSISNFYEGAATAKIGTERVGYAWVEHMQKW